MDQSEEKKWFVFLGDHHEGPFSAVELQSKLNQKQLSISSFVWAEGMADWKPLNEIDALAPAELGPTPPPPPSNASKYGKLPTSLYPAPRKAGGALGRILKLMVLVAILAGGYFLYSTGQLASFYSGTHGIDIQSMVSRVKDSAYPELIALSEKYPVLAQYVSPIPRLDDVGPDEYQALKSAAMASLSQAGPSLAVALSRSNPVSPSFYVSTNLPDGAQFNIYVVGVSGTLVGRLHAVGGTRVAVSKRLGQSQALKLTDGTPLPRGEYQIFVTESETQPAAVKAILLRLPPLNAAGTEGLPPGLKLLARRSCFLGGVKDAIYSQQLKTYHDDLRQKASLEINELTKLSNTLENQVQLTSAKFKALGKGRAMTTAKKRSWQSFHASWTQQESALSQPFGKLSPVELREEYFYASLYDLVRQADQAAQRLHGLQDAYFQKKSDARALEIQLGESESVTQSAIMALRTKIEQLEKAPPAQDGMPPSI